MLITEAHDEKYAQMILDVLVSFQEGAESLEESVELLQSSIIKISDRDLREELDATWDELEQIASPEESEDGAETSGSKVLSGAEAELLERIVKKFRKIISRRSMGQVSYWELYCCKVCGYDQGTFMPWGPRGVEPSFLSCSCCGTEFGKEDARQILASNKRKTWLESGAKWWDVSAQPKNWDTKKQLDALPAWWKN